MCPMCPIGAHCGGTKWGTISKVKNINEQLTQYRVAPQVYEPLETVLYFQYCRKGVFISKIRCSNFCIHSSCYLLVVRYNRLNSLPGDSGICFNILTETNTVL